MRGNKRERKNNLRLMGADLIRSDQILFSRKWLNVDPATAEQDYELPD